MRRRARPAPTAAASRKRSAKRITSSSSPPSSASCWSSTKQHPEFIRPEASRNEVLSFVRGGLKDLSISRTSFDWGIPVPGDEKHVIYVWMDALANYITALGYGSDDPEDQQRFAPLLARRPAAGGQGDHPLSLRLLAGLPHGRRSAAAQERGRQRMAALRAKQDVQVARKRRARGDDCGDSGGGRAALLSLREVVFGQDGSFSFDALVQRYNADLANGYGNLTSRTLAMITQYFGGVVPAGEADPRIVAAAETAAREFAAAF